MSDRTYAINGIVITETGERTYAINSIVITETQAVVTAGRIMSSLAGSGGLAGLGGIAGRSGGLAG